MKRIISFILCLFVLMSVITVCPNISEKAVIKTFASEFTDKSGDLTVSSPTKEQIKTMWENITTYDTKFDVEPSTVAPYSIGKLNADYLQSGEDYLNLMRYIAGLPAIEMSDEFNESAQYGAVLLAASEFSHYPDQPADMDDEFYNKGVSGTSSSNIALGYRDISSSISGYMSDEDPSNIYSVGHRRWLLNPKLYYVGFGEANNRFTTKVFDQSGSGVDYNFISWPPSGNCPDSFFRYDDPWSITLNPSEYNSISDIKIILTRTDDGKTWVFDSNTSNDPNTEGDFLNMNMSGYGVSNAIVFRPALADMVPYSGIYTVEVSGLYDKNDTAVTLKYQTDFFNFYDYYKVVSYPTEIGGECTIGCEECDYTKTFATSSEMDISWSLDGGAVSYSGFDNIFNVGDKLYLHDLESYEFENGKIIHITDESAIGFEKITNTKYVFSFNKEGIYTFTIYYRYAPHIYNTYTVYVGNTDGCTIPEPYIPHTEVINYPTEMGGDCTIGCENCEFTNSFTPNTSMELWWNRDDSGTYWGSFNNNFNIGEHLNLWDDSGSGIENEKIIELSDESAIKLDVSSNGHYTFTFAKEGVYSFTIYCKYVPDVYRTYTVVVKDPNKTYNMGDVNEDGEIDKKDYALLKRYCFNTIELSSSQLLVADINGDREVDKMDYSLLKRACFGTYVIE